MPRSTVIRPFSTFQKKWGTCDGCAGNGVDRAALFEFLTRMGDNTLILGPPGVRMVRACRPCWRKTSRWPTSRLDLIGQTQLWLGLAGEVEGKGRTADNLAYLRDAAQFRNVLLVERPNGDFGQHADAAVPVRRMAS